MADSVTVFLSYNERDRDRAARVVRLLEDGGWTVWWDRRIPAGRTWRDVLTDALEHMDCMVVLWSRNSIDSDWVCEEASEGQRAGRLVPVALDPVLPPVGFRQIQAADLSSWDGSPQHAAARQLLDDIASLVRKPTDRDDSDRVDDTARHNETVVDDAEAAGRVLDALRRRMLSADSLNALERLRWELDELTVTRPLWPEARQLREQLDRALELEQRRAEPSTAPAARGPRARVLGTALALALIVALLTWWLWPRTASRNVELPVGVPVEPARPAKPPESAPKPSETAPMPSDNAAPDRADPDRSPMALPKSATPEAGKRPSKPAPTATARGALPPRCSDLLGRQSLGEPLGADDRTFLEKECSR